MYTFTIDMWLSSGWRQSSDCAVSTLKSLSVGKTSTANVVVLISWDRQIFKNYSPETFGCWLENHLQFPFVILDLCPGKRGESYLQIRISHLHCWPSLIQEHCRRDLSAEQPGLRSDPTSNGVIRSTMVLPRLSWRFTRAWLKNRAHSSGAV